MPVATKGSPRQLTLDQIKQVGTNMVIANGLLLWLRPGLDVIQNAGGLHKFIGWDKSIFTDSGGFQMLSKNLLLQVGKKTVQFRSPYDNQPKKVTPSSMIKIQNAIGSDVAMALDYVEHYSTNKSALKKAMLQTTKWAEECKKAHANKEQLLFGITQGGIFPDLRKQSTKDIEALDFDGIALGGLCIGEPKETTLKMIDLSLPLIPDEKPRYLMGLGSPQELLDSVKHGIDIFDSCFPTRVGRHGMVFSSEGTIDILKGRFSNQFEPIDKKCGCNVCKTTTKAYVHHLLKSGVPLGGALASLHNTAFIQEEMRRILELIKKGEGLPEEYQGLWVN